MVLREVGGVRKGEDVEDLRAFLKGLDGAPPVHETVVLACDNHGDEDRPTWAYVEADASKGIARRRCLQCAKSIPVLDSAERWSHPQMWSCGSCGQSIAEFAAGLSLPDGQHVDWVVLGVRCVECGRIDGVADLVVPKTPVADVLSSL